MAGEQPPRAQHEVAAAGVAPLPSSVRGRPTPALCLWQGPRGTSGTAVCEVATTVAANAVEGRPIKESPKARHPRSVAQWPPPLPTASRAEVAGPFRLPGARGRKGANGTRLQVGRAPCPQRAKRTCPLPLRRRINTTNAKGAAGLKGTKGVVETPTPTRPAPVPEAKDNVLRARQIGAELPPRAGPLHTPARCPSAAKYPTPIPVHSPDRHRMPTTKEM